MHKIEPGIQLNYFERFDEPLSINTFAETVIDELLDKLA
jgi:hypothetical protein